MWGTLQAEGEARILRFERHYKRPIEKVWAALITPERIADWWCADAEVEPRVGGRFHLAFRNGPHTMTGVITILEPPHRLTYTWTEAVAKGDSLVSWELFPQADGCRLVLTHTLPSGGETMDFLSGWHWHLDALVGALNGVAAVWDSKGWETLKEEYKIRVKQK